MRMMEVFILKFQSIAEYQIPEIMERWWELYTVYVHVSYMGLLNWDVHVVLRGSHVCVSGHSHSLIVCQVTVIASLSSFLAVLLYAMRPGCTEPGPETGKTIQAKFGMR